MGKYNYLDDRLAEDIITIGKEIINHFATHMHDYRYSKGIKEKVYSWAAISKEVGWDDFEIAIPTSECVENQIDDAEYGSRNAIMMLLRWHRFWKVAFDEEQRQNQKLIMDALQRCRERFCI